MYDAYDGFAWVYNRHWGDFSEKVLPLVRRMALDGLPAGARILDLCCGTGQLARALTDLGYAVVGVDGSAEMLRYARENAPGASFVHDDARSFSLPERFDVVLSMYDSLNHIMDLGELTDVFRRARAVLEPRGVFLFDLNMRPGYEGQWRSSFAIVEDAYAVAVRNEYDQDASVGTFRATLFFRREDGKLWERGDVTLTQRVYEREQVQSALEAAGFEDIAVEAPDPKTPIDAAGRLFFLAHCQKPGAGT